MRKSLAVSVVILVVILAVMGMALPAHAADQVVTANLGNTLSMDTPPSSTVSNWALASVGSNTTSGGSIGINANLPYTISVTADKSKLSEYDTGSSAYVSSGKTLTTALSVVSARNSGTAVVPGVAATAVVGTSTLLAVGTGLGTDVYGLTLSQPTLITDSALASGRTYRIVLTYTAASTL